MSPHAIGLVCGALDELLAAVAGIVEDLDDDLYQTVEREIFRSSPGAHIRHLLDHVRALFEGLETGLICYDRRMRGTAVETDRECCLVEIEGLRATLAGYQHPDPNRATVFARRVTVEQIVDPNAAPIRLESVGLRELVFVFQHSIHHAALLGARLRQAGVPVPEFFGIAPATLAANR